MFWLTLYNQIFTLQSCWAVWTFKALLICHYCTKFSLREICCLYEIEDARFRLLTKLSFYVNTWHRTDWIWPKTGFLWHVLHRFWPLLILLWLSLKSVKSHKIKAIYERHSWKNHDEVVTCTNTFWVGQCCFTEDLIGAEENHETCDHQKENCICVDD